MAAAIEKTDLYNRLEKVHGLDVQKGLLVARGRIDFYTRLLSMFVDSHSGDPSRLRVLASSEGDDTLARLVHSLKGAAGNIGARHLSEQAADLMAGLRVPRIVLSGPVIVLANELEQLLEGLRQALGTADDTSSVEVGTDRAGEVLPRLRQLLRTGSLGAADLARSEEALPRAVLGHERWREFRRYINTFSFEKALSLLDEGTERSSENIL